MKLLMIFVIISFLIACEPFKKKSQITPETRPPNYTPNIEDLQLENRTKDDKLISEEEYKENGIKDRRLKYLDEIEKRFNEKKQLMNNDVRQFLNGIFEESEFRVLFDWSALGYDNYIQYSLTGKANSLMQYDLISEEEYKNILNEINNKYGKIVWQDELMSE